MPELPAELTPAMVERCLERIVADRPSSPDPIWRECFAPGELGRALLEQAFEVLAAHGGEGLGALHGWIDQAVLEVVDIAPLPRLRERALSYRPDQGGDSGILAAGQGRLLLLHVSFQGGSATLCEFPLHPLPGRSPGALNSETPPARRTDRSIRPRPDRSGT